MEERLLDLFDQGFDDQEMAEIARELGVEWGKLPDRGFRARTLALIQQCQRQGTLDALVEAAQRERPHLPWNAALAGHRAPTPPAPLAAPAHDHECEARAQRRADRWMTGIILAAIVALIPVGWAIVEWWDVVEPLKEVLAILAALLVALFRVVVGKLPYAWLADALLTQARDAEKCAQPGTAINQRAALPPLSLADAERAYLARREGDVQAELARKVYVTLSGQTRELRQPPAMDQFFKLHPALRGEHRTADEPAREFQNIRQEIAAHPRALLVGKPGSGKTTTLRSLDAHWRTAPKRGRFHRVPPDPLPLFIPLKAWTQPLPDGLDLAREADLEWAADEFERFLGSQCHPLARHLPDLWRSGRAYLLLDGLDQIASSQRSAKALAIKRWAERYPKQRLLLSSRQADLDAARLEFDLPRIEIAELRPSSVRAFIRRYVAAARQISERAATQEADALFWRIAGGEAIEQLWQTWHGAGATLDQFWDSEDIPRDAPDVFGETSPAEDQLWRERVRRPEPLFRMARTPYILNMMVVIALRDGKLPDNRGALFAEFINTLLESESRERQAGLATYDPATRQVALTPDGEALISVLEGLAVAMLRQREAAGGGDRSDVSLPRDEVVPQQMSERQLSQALGASLLEISGTTVIFSHQLLQEYLAARQIRREIAAGSLQADQIFRADQWWEETSWREAAMLLAELDPEDDAPIRWMADANPLVTADAIRQRGGASRETLLWLRERWKARLTDPTREPHPYARAAVGRALAHVTLDGRMLDNRPGVGVDKKGVPQIDWVYLEGGSFPIGGDDAAYNSIPGPTMTKIQPFAMARYPVTNAQWDAFLRAEDGYANRTLWERAGVPQQEAASPRWREGNHPRETVTWYEAVAFCAWLSSRLGYEVRLPTEIEWERAARGKEGRIMPWGARQPESGYANVDEADRFDLGGGENRPLLSSENQPCRHVSPRRDAGGHLRPEWQRVGVDEPRVGGGGRRNRW